MILVEEYVHWSSLEALANHLSAELRFPSTKLDKLQHLIFTAIHKVGKGPFSHRDQNLDSIVALFKVREGQSQQLGPEVPSPSTVDFVSP